MIHSDKILLRALKAELKKALRKFAKASDIEARAMSCGSRLIELRAEAQKMIQSGEFKTKEGIAKLDAMVKQEKAILADGKIDLVKAMESAFAARQELDDIQLEISRVEYRLQRSKA